MKGGVSWARGAWRGAILVAALASAAALVDLGSFHRLEQGDSLVPVLVSLQRWTPFFWDQERFGMLVPLVALPLRDPLANLLLQRALTAFAGLASLVLLARHALAGRDWPLAGLLAAGTLLLLAPAPWLFEYLASQPYGLSTALALAGLALAEPPGAGGGGAAWPPRLAWLRTAAALLLVVAAHWVNAVAGIVLLGLALARAGGDLVEGTERRAVRARLVREGALLGAGLAAGHVFLRLYPLLTGHRLRLAMGALPVERWPRAWTSFFGLAWHDERRWGLALVAIAAAGLALLLTRPLRPQLAGALVRAGALLAAALGYALFAGALEWVEANAFHWRYLAPSAVLVHLAAVSLLAEPLARLPRLAAAAGSAALALVPAAALAAYGAPSLARVRADLDAAAGARTEDVLAAGCELVAGDYWSVWPTVWHAALVARERGLARRVYGLTHRSNPTAPLWKGRPPESLRICRPAGEEEHAERWLRAFHLWPVRGVGRQGTVDVLVPVGAASATSGTTPAASR
ncbi:MULTISPECIES: hypothetical protein [unclassified Anaeromyxobacter]|uniref:hypothetical protein n=2 Tax=Anaeromyxobacter TaxID=161492 RepID=UPI001F56FAD7|nr:MULTISPECIES: hypothetical protein [unclassified Anaeromyxobacter]